MFWSTSIFPSPTLSPPHFTQKPTILSCNFSPSGKPSSTCTYSNKPNTESHYTIFKDFSVLSSELPWEEGSVWSTMGLYFFSVHIPLSFGGLSVVSQMLHQSVLDPQTEAVSIFLIQTLELCATITLLKYTAKPHSKLASFLLGSKFSEERNWVQAAAVGFAVLILIVFVTSFLADRLIGPKAVNNSILKEVISSGSVSTAACFLTYCFATPLLEEIVYRGFLLGSLASTMKWNQAVIVSSCIFSVAHFSGENSLQLFIIGCVLGCSYCWSGNLRSSFLLHSLYNAATLFITIVS